MPKRINFDAVEEPTGGYEEIEAGVYRLTITDVQDEVDKERMWLLFDIADGEHKGFYGRDEFYADKPYTHRFMLSYKERALGMLKHRLRILSECNLGFDAEDAFNNNLNSFMGKTVYAGVGLEENRANNGNVYTRPDWFHANWGTAQDAADGKIKVPALVPLEDEGTGMVDSDSSAGVYDVLPF